MSSETCIRHVSRTAVARCLGCDDPLCALCCAGPYCKSCARRHAAGQTRSTPLRAVALAVCVGLVVSVGGALSLGALIGLLLSPVPFASILVLGTPLAVGVAVGEVFNFFVDDRPGPLPRVLAALTLLTGELIARTVLSSAIQGSPTDPFGWSSAGSIAFIGVAAVIAARRVG